MSTCFVCQDSVYNSPNCIKIESNKWVCPSCSRFIVATYLAKHMVPLKTCKVCGGSKHRTNFRSDANVCDDCCEKLGKQFEKRNEKPCKYCDGEGQTSLTSARTGVTNTFVCPQCMGSGHQT